MYFTAFSLTNTHHWTKLKDWNGVNMPPAEDFSFLSLESTPMFLCSGLPVSFSWILHFCTCLCPGLSTSEALYRLVALLNDSKCGTPISDHDKSIYERVQRKYQKKVGWNKHARPIPIKGRPSKKKKKERKKERRGRLPSANVNTQKNLRWTLPTLSQWTW